MTLHPLRDALSQAGLRAFQHESTFKGEVDTALSRFQAIREDLELQVKRGDLTVKTARDRARHAASQLETDLKRRAETHATVPRVFLDRLSEASVARKRARDRQSLEGLQRETNRLLRASLVEQQLRNRAEEFEGRAFVRATPGGRPAPTLSSLLAFHEAASNAGDEAAREWARRQLEGFRSRVVDPADVARIDAACDRPEAVNPRIVARYLGGVDRSDIAALETFVEQALESRDANACVAAFVLAREIPGSESTRWGRTILNGASVMPDAALETLRGLEAEARSAEAEAARNQADYAIAMAASQVRLDGVEPPTEAELVRQARVEAKPHSRLGEPIGLALERRGFDVSQLDEILAGGDRDDTTA